MILKLRNRHRSIWMVLLVILPIGFYLSLSSRPQSLDFSSLPPEVKGTILATAHSEQLAAYLLQEGADKQGILIQILQPITQASAAIYLKQGPNGQPDQSLFLGKAGPVGQYWFPLDSLHLSLQQPHLFLYDQLKEEKFQELPLNAQ